METRVHSSFESFWAQAGVLYEADPGRHSVPLTIMAARHTYESGPTPVLVTIHGMDGVVGAYLRTPPFPAHVGTVPPDLASLTANVLREHDPTLDVVFGPEREAHAFADAWCREDGECKSVEMRQRRYELGELRPPSGVPGSHRPFEDADVAWLARWRAEYARDAGDRGVGSAPSEKSMRAFINGGREPVLWAVGDQPRAMAFASRPLCGMSRIGHVFTPAHYRGNGFGSAVTAAASAEALAMGADLVMLYADLSNPVSNSIYQRIGFRPVDDLVQLRLSRSWG